MAAGFSEDLWEKFVMCDPRWTPEHSISRYLDPTDVSPTATEVKWVINYLRDLGVRGGRRDWATVSSDMEFKTAAGCGFTCRKLQKVFSEMDFVEHVNSMRDLPIDESIDLLSDEQIQGCTRVAVKEELTKASKIKDKRYRTFFIPPLPAVFEKGMAEDELEHQLIEKGVLCKGEDMRTHFHELWNMREHGYLAQSDCTSMDITMSRSLMKAIFQVKQALGCKYAPGFVEWHLNPVVVYMTEGGDVRYMKPQRGHLSGVKGTSMDGTLGQLFVLARYCNLHGVLRKDVFATGVGDDNHFVSRQPWHLDTLKLAFAELGFKAQVWLVQQASDFEFLGGTLRWSPEGLQPHWDLEKSIVRCCYEDKRWTVVDRLMRLCMVWHFNVYHPKAHMYVRFFYRRFEQLRRFMTKAEREQVLTTWYSAWDFYWQPQRKFTLGGLKSDQQIPASMTTPFESTRFEKLVEKCGATPSGSKWLKMALDPFHDVDLELIGLPDATGGRSVLYNVTKSVTLTVPSSVSAGNRWDCHVAFNPLLDNASASMCIPMVTASGTLNYLDEVNVGATTAPSGIIRACSVPEGTATFLGGANETYDVLGYQEILATEASSTSRLVGAAFEVHNVTEDLHKSGAVTCYRFETSRSKFNVRYLNSTSTARTDRVEMDICGGPPTDQAQAKLLNGRTWEAGEGCLVPIIMEQDNPPQHFVARHCGMVVQSAAGADYIWTNQDNKSCYNRYDSPYTTTTPASLPQKAAMLLPFEASGAYFTGLAYETALTISARFFVEVFPAPGNNLVSLAQPAAPVDSRALQCYSEIISDLLPGYPVRDNDAGDFFRKVLGAAKKLSAMARPIVGVAQTIPQLKGVATAMSAGMDLVDKIPEKKKKPKKKGK